MWSAAGFCSGTSSLYSAYDSQLHILSVPSDFPVLVCCLKGRTDDVAEWMGDSKFEDE